MCSKIDKKAYAMEEMIMDATDVPTLIERLKTGDSDTRSYAAQCLGEINDARAIDPLIAATKDESISVPWCAMKSLGKLNMDKPLIKILEDKTNYSSKRSNAIAALQELTDPRAISRTIDALIQALKDGEPDVRAHSAKTLGHFRDPRSIDPLVPMIKDIDPDTRREAILSLGIFNDPRTIDPLIYAIKYDGKENIRKEAANCLNKINNPKAIDHLIQALLDSDENVRVNAIIALGNIDDPRVEKVLTNAVNDGNPRIKKVAAEILYKHSKKFPKKKRWKF